MFSLSEYFHKDHLTSGTGELLQDVTVLFRSGDMFAEWFSHTNLSAKFNFQTAIFAMWIWLHSDMLNKMEATYITDFNHLSGPNNHVTGSLKTEDQN